MNSAPRKPALDSWLWPFWLKPNPKSGLATCCYPATRCINSGESQAIHGTPGQVSQSQRCCFSHVFKEPLHSPGRMDYVSTSDSIVWRNKSESQDEFFEWVRMPSGS